MVPFAAASSGSNSVSPGFQPSSRHLVVGLAALALADDDLDAVVAHVERLPAALHAVAEHGDGLVLEDLPHAVRRVIGPLDALLNGVADTNLFHGSTHWWEENVCSAGEGMGN